jgi:hypothetical protein
MSIRIELKMRKFLWIALFLLSCTDEERAREVLEGNGYTNIQLTGYQWGACSQEDTSHTGFQALSPAKVMVRGTVCCGLILKNCTIRFE